MASSPSGSSASPCTANSSHDQQEVLSDDSGVDVKPQSRGQDLQFSGDSIAESSSRRNKRKSSEPRKRGDGLLMKQFRWDSEEEREEDNEDNLERERPSSGDSGCQGVDDTVPPVRVVEKKKRQRSWRKPKQEIIRREEDASKSPFRQSVICKNEVSNSPCTQRFIHSHTSQATSTASSIPSSQTTAIVCEDECSGDSCNPLRTQTFLHQHPQLTGSTSSCVPASDADDEVVGIARGTGSSRPCRNYKGMSRQRRIEANARERTRVHTISAAFESLRRAVPAYAHNQKLSKLAILRIASAYIVALACLNQGPQESESPPLSDCVERCTRTIQAEGRSRRRTTSKD